MKREIKLLTFCYLFVLLLLMLSANFKGFLQIIIYISAFLVPTFVGIRLLKEQGNASKIFDANHLKIRKDEVGVSLLLVSPSLFAILLISYLTSLLFFVTMGKENGNVLAEGAAISTLIHALLPSVLEELAFRYLPLITLGKKSPRVAVFASAFFFALIHRSFFSIPYAFAAGVIFMALDIACDSILPSLIIHFINNVLALMTMGVYGFTLEISYAFIIVGAFALLSSLLLFFERKRLTAMVKRAFASGERYSLSHEPLFFAVPAIIIAVSELFI